MSELEGLCEMIGDTYSKSLLVDCSYCNGSGVTPPSGNLEKDICFAMLISLGARTSYNLPGSKCPWCDGRGKTEDESRALAESVKVTKKWYPGLAKSLEDGWDGHNSDCATHNEPAMLNGPCTCVVDNTNLGAPK